MHVSDWWITLQDPIFSEMCLKYITSRLVQICWLLFSSVFMNPLQQTEFQFMKKSFHNKHEINSCLYFSCPNFVYISHCLTTLDLFLKVCIEKVISDEIKIIHTASNYMLRPRDHYKRVKGKCINCQLKVSRARIH